MIQSHVDQSSPMSYVSPSHVVSSLLTVWVSQILHREQKIYERLNLSSR